MPLFPCSDKENEAVQGVGAFSGGSLKAVELHYKASACAALNWTPDTRDCSCANKGPAGTQGNSVFFKRGDSV